MSDDNAALCIFTAIDDADGDGLTAARFNSELEALGEIDGLTLRVNSAGGDVVQGMGIYNAIAGLDYPVVCRIEGLAASAASLIAMAADRVEIASNSFMLVHEPFGGMLGTADELQHFADDMRKMTAAYVSIYAARTGLEPDKIMTLMGEDRLMTASEAVELGFADAIYEPKGAATVKINARALSDRHRSQLAALKSIKSTKKGDIKTMAIKIKAKGEVDDSMTLSELQEELQAMKARLVALESDTDDSGDGDARADADTDDDADKDVDIGVDASDDGDGDESDDGGTENRGAGKARAKQAAAKARAYAVEVSDLCNLAGLPALASGFIASSVSLPAVRRQLLVSRAARDTGRTSNYRSGESAPKNSGEAISASWDVAISKVFPQRKK